MSYSTIVTACVFAWAFEVALPLIYLGSRWKDKFDSLQGYFNAKSLRLYYQLFKPAVVITAQSNIKELFKGHYNESYGRKNFILPFLFFASISAITFCFISRTLLHYIDDQYASSPLPPIVMISLLGAYMWVGFDQVQRFRTQDFTFHDVNIWALRFLISVPVGYFFSYTVKDPIGIPLAFFLGAFPINTLMKFSRRLATKYLSTGDEKEPDSSELENLQGVKRQESERFQNEGISNILQLAYSDPIDLTMRTNFDFLYVVDLKGQALLWIYLESKINDLRILSMRSAHEAAILNGLLKSKSKNQRDMANLNLNEICQHLKISQDSFRNILFEVAEDPHTIFIVDIWCPGRM
jgi:hypothetical protein